MSYNKEKHLNLVKYDQQLKLEGKDISEESEKDFFALNEYTLMLVAHLHWENRQQYFELIEQLLKEPLDFLELRKKYRSIDVAGEMLQKKLIFLEPNKKGEGFIDLIDEIISLSNRYCPDPSIRESYEFNEQELKELIQKILIEMKEKYP